MFSLSLSHNSVFKIQPPHDMPVISNVNLLYSWYLKFKYFIKQLNLIRTLNMEFKQEQSIYLSSIYNLPPIEPSNVNVFRSCHAHVQRSHVVSPSDEIDSSRKGGRGGGGTKRPFHRPLSLASNGIGESNESDSMAFSHQSASPVNRLKASSSKVNAADSGTLSADGDEDDDKGTPDVWCKNDVAGCGKSADEALNTSSLSGPWGRGTRENMIAGNEKYSIGIRFVIRIFYYYK